MTNDLVRLLSDLKEEEVLKTVTERLHSGEEPLNILDDARRAMEIVGKRFADADYFIPACFVAASLFFETDCFFGG